MSWLDYVVGQHKALAGMAGAEIDQPEGYPEPEENELYPEGLPDGREWEIRTYLHLSI